MMGKTFRYYTMLRPLRDTYIDDDSAILCRIPVIGNGRPIEVALIGGPGDPWMIRVSVSNVEEDPPYEERKHFDDLTESILSLLRIFHDKEMTLAEPRLRYANVLDDGLPAALNIKLRTSVPIFDVNPGLMFSYMNSEKKLRDIFRLYADAIYPYSPVQYRYLSAFKIVEHEFKADRRKWKPTLDILLNHFEAEYAALDVSRMKMKAFMIHLRDKCAHIKLGDAEHLTIVGIGSQDTEVVIRILPLLIKIIQKHLFDTYKSDGKVYRAVAGT
jgi:hypothetical protein